MREILFKAKRKDDGKWVEGYYQKRYDLLGNEEHLIFHADSYKVWEYAEIDSETLCQFTGLCCKNGNKIWENDIIQYDTVAAVAKFGEYGNGGLGFYVDFPEETNYRKDFSYWSKKVVVIGNAVDDRNLLQEVPE